MRRSKPNSGVGMHAVDTNIVVRYLTDDDPEQSPIARRFVDSNDTFLALMVLLESEWVLRSAHKLDCSRILHILRLFAGLPRVKMERAAIAAQALDWFEQGMDFADAMHLASADDYAFATFDRKMAAAAKKAGAGKIKVL